MAYKKITELPELELIDVVDDLDQIVLVVVDNSSSPATTKKIKLSSIDTIFERSISAKVSTASTFSLEAISGTNIQENYTVPSGYIARTKGPAILSPNVNVTVSAGSEWIIY